MIRLLLRLYPAGWRTRYGDEFAAVLEERPLGPFDVADVLLGALDAHLHLRGLGAASHHVQGIVMSLRIGGFAAIAGGILWFIGLAASSLDATEDGTGLWVAMLIGGTVLLLVALVGLSAFQARRYPRAAWAAFLLPAVGAAVSIVGMVAMALIGDRAFVGDLTPWYVWILGLMAMLVGSALFALVTWLTRSLSRVAAVILAVGSLLTLSAGVLGIGGVIAEQYGQWLIAAVVALFAIGWIGLGVSALRRDRPVSTSFEGATP
jgi:hypothetical protein